MLLSSKPDLSRIGLSVSCRLTHHGQYTSAVTKQLNIMKGD
jgi:hypothetical protein